MPTALCQTTHTTSICTDHDFDLKLDAELSTRVANLTLRQLRKSSFCVHIQSRATNRNQSLNRLRIAVHIQPLHMQVESSGVFSIISITQCTKLNHRARESCRCTVCFIVCNLNLSLSVLQEAFLAAKYEAAHHGGIGSHLTAHMAPIVETTEVLVSFCPMLIFGRIHPDIYVQIAVICLASPCRRCGPLYELI